MLETTTLTPLGYQILEHWRSHRPTMVENLTKGNQLQQAVFAAQEFLAANPPQTARALEDALIGTPITFELHREFKKRVPDAIGLIRTGDTTQYSNLILESA